MNNIFPAVCYTDSVCNFVLLQLCSVADCLKSGKPSQLAGDIFFNFTCADCNASEAEKCERLKLLW